VPIRRGGSELVSCPGNSRYFAGILIATKFLLFRGQDTNVFG
jgi:hypothetical protein